MSKNPIATGRITVSTIETNIGSALIEICAPLARYDTRSGVINGERIVDTVVIPTEKATSPPQRYDMIFEETPPGQHPTSISPSPIPSESPRTFVIPKAKKGIIRYCAIAPTHISNGLFANILKSCAVNVRPILNMIIPIMID